MGIGRCFEVCSFYLDFVFAIIRERPYAIIRIAYTFSMHTTVNAAEHFF